jgi:hypothetical protein
MGKNCLHVSNLVIFIDIDDELWTLINDGVTFEYMNEEGIVSNADRESFTNPLCLLILG